MKVVEYSTPQRFMGATHPLWEAREAENSVVLGWLMRLLRGQVPREEVAAHRFGVAGEDGRAQAGVVGMPGDNDFITHGPEEAVKALAAAVLSAQPGLSGVFGSAEGADAFAGAWANLTGRHRQQTSVYTVYKLTKAIAPPRPTGDVRNAAPDDLPLTLEWHRAFGAEVIPPQSIAEEAVRARSADGGVFLWCDPEPVAMASYSGYTLNGVLIGKVYTPPELRGRSYASALISALSHRALLDGRQFCCLLASPLSPLLDRLYTRIGYRATGSCTGYAFG